ncbi:30S ribosomal protein S11 [Conglomerata obtusa]
MSENLEKLKVFPIQPQQDQHPYQAPERFYRNLGFGLTTPETAIHGTYIDKKCPFTGIITIRPVFIRGEVIKMKNEKTIVMKKKYLHYHKKYKRYERRNTKFNVHMSPCFFGLVNVGDEVVCAETRSLSKTKNFVVVDFVKSIKSEKGYKILK